MSSNYGYLLAFLILPVFAADPLDVQEIDLKADNFRSANTGVISLNF